MGGGHPGTPPTADLLGHQLQCTCPPLTTSEAPHSPLPSLPCHLGSDTALPLLSHSTRPPTRPTWSPRAAPEALATLLPTVLEHAMLSGATLALSPGLCPDPGRCHPSRPRSPSHAIGHLPQSPALALSSPAGSVPPTHLMYHLSCSPSVPHQDTAWRLTKAARSPKL